MSQFQPYAENWQLPTQLIFLPIPGSGLKLTHLTHVSQACPLPCLPRQSQASNCIAAASASFSCGLRGTPTRHQSWLKIGRYKINVALLLCPININSKIILFSDWSKTDSA